MKNNCLNIPRHFVSLVILQSMTCKRCNLKRFLKKITLTRAIMVKEYFSISQIVTAIIVLNYFIVYVIGISAIYQG